MDVGYEDHPQVKTVPRAMQLKNRGDDTVAEPTDSQDEPTTPDRDRKENQLVSEARPFKLSGGYAHESKGSSAQHSLVPTNFTTRSHIDSGGL